ncbi:MAG: HNH nuclease family protein [Syntrophaceae bacterium]|nr:HNH nuclease family protein [Syntrophaceae bacterium]
MRSAEEVVREIKKNNQKPHGEDYRERSLRLHGLVCARCGREFNEANRHLLTVHHKDGNHQNNPADGSNWENLCVYCHEDEHSRSLLGEYYAGGSHERETAVVYSEDSGQNGDVPTGLGSLAEQLRKALEKKSGKG